MKKRGYRSRVLVTGGLGFIGKNLVPVLEEDFDVFTWDLQEGTDIFDDELETFIKNRDVVIHLAALTNVSESFRRKRDFYITNVLGTARIAYLCAKHKCKLIYPSSAAVYHRELSPYAETKALAEDIAKGLGDGATILRFFNIYGPGLNKNSGSIMYNFLHDDPITIYGDGEQTRDYINIYDLVHIIKDSVKRKWDGKIVDVGTGQAYSANYVAGLFAGCRDVRIEYVPPKREIKWSIADTNMLKTLYKKPLTTNLEKDIMELCQN